MALLWCSGRLTSHQIQGKFCLSDFNEIFLSMSVTYRWWKLDFAYIQEHITVPIQLMHVISNIIERSKGGYSLTGVASRFNRNHTNTSSTTSGVVIAGDFNTSETIRRLIKGICKPCYLEVISHSPNSVSPNKWGLMYRPCSWKCEDSTHSHINMLWRLSWQVSQITPQFFSKST